MLPVSVSLLAAPPSRMEPPLIVVVPLKVLMPDKVKAPAPSLVSDPVPEMTFP